MTNPQAVSAVKPRQSAMATGSRTPASRSTSSFGRQARTPFHNSALADALRGVLILTRPDPHTERSFVALARGAAGTPAALAAARAGDSRAADELELHWRNAWGIKPTVEHLIGTRSQYLQSLAMGMQRGGGPNGETLIEWGVVDPCPRCWRRPTMRAKCTRCNGQGHVSEEWVNVYTDLDGNVVGNDALEQVSRENGK